MREGPLDMRMDRNKDLTAADVVNTYSEKEIADILYSNAEERRSRAIARSIVRARPLSLTTDLARAVARVMGSPRYGKIHPATRTFQALRIYVNDELKSLETFLDSSMTVIRTGGRLVVVTFHSLEDRIVKNFIRTNARPGEAPERLPLRAADLPPARLRSLGKPRRPEPGEVAANPRARSAVLRVAQKLG